MQDTVRNLLAQADIQIDGDRPWDIHVHDPDFYGRVLGAGSLGLGESYMDGWWDCRALDQCLCKILKAGLAEKVTSLREKMHRLVARVTNQQRKARAFEVGKRHYDIGNDLYEKMLDRRMVYSCGYWKQAETLDEAQEAKLELICQKIQLRPGMRVLDIGCGWGSFAKYAAEHYQAAVVGVTVSKEQRALAAELCRGLPVEIMLQDYRVLRPELNGRFDAVVSVGMFEHVGYKNYPAFFRVVDACLQPAGLFLLHTMGVNQAVYSGDPWVNTYIFPGGSLPSMQQLGEATDGLLMLEDWHSFSSDYVRTLRAWCDNFRANWSGLQARYDDRFRRMWEYYLLSFAAGFAARRIQLWQIVFSKDRPPGYQSVR